MKLPPAPTMTVPKREALIELFDRVKFHPLSIRVLAAQLKTRRIAELGERLESLLARPLTPALSPEGGEGARRAGEGEDTPAGLLASLELSLDRLDETARQVLPRLGVFQGGAFEDGLIAITGLGEEPGSRARIESMLAQLPPAPAANLWPDLRRQLEAAALIEAESVPGVTVPFLGFHPTLAPMLWAQLDAGERARLTTAHRQRYYALSRYLFQQHDRNPHQARAIAWRELPNLLHAVHAALDAGDPDAGTFAAYVTLFLGTIFGFKQEAERLTARAQAAAGQPGSDEWLLAQSNRGNQLLEAGQVVAAAEVFQAILKELGDQPSYDRAATLGRLGRCFRADGRPDRAAEKAQEAVRILRGLDQSDYVHRTIGVRLTDLADALYDQGKLAEARQAYLEGLKVDEKLHDLRGKGVTLGQLGTLAMREGSLAEAEKSYRAALDLFQQLREPASEAVAWHQLGRVFEEARQWDEAERHYRESARIQEERGNLAGAAQTWNQLATVARYAGKPDAAEMWYRKAVEGNRAIGSSIGLSRNLHNLADLLQRQPGRLAEARQLADEALAISKTLDPGAAEIWKTYEVLARIAEQEEALGVPPSGGSGGEPAKAGTTNQAREYRRLARTAKRNYAGTRHELRRHLPVILGTIMAVQDPAHRAQLEQALPGMEQRGWINLVAALRRILAGERDADALCEALDWEDSMIIETILTGLSDPSSLSDLLPTESSEAP